MRAVVIIAHPDDEVLGCGATLARLSDEGHEIRVLLALRRSDPRGVASWDRILGDFNAACAVLGVTPVMADPLLEERAADSDVRDLLDLIRPHVEWSETVFTHWPGDVHQVHRGVSRAVEIATRPFRLRRNVYFFEVATSTDQAYVQHFSPQLFVTVGPDHVERKVKAMSCYSTEEASGRSALDVRRNLESRGAQIGVPHAEAFVVARQFL
jgi:LmbE family N-acetylglucosaminyl deacetylase